MNSVKFIAAIDDKNGLAKNGHIPWNLPKDKQFFRDSITVGSAIMGWNTFASNKYKPFPTSPRNLVVTESKLNFPGVETVNDLIGFVQGFKGGLWVIGGGSIFKQLLPYATHLYLTRVKGDFGCDVFFPEFEATFKLVEEKPPQIENGIEFRYQLWQPKLK